MKGSKHSQTLIVFYISVYAILICCCRSETFEVIQVSKDLLVVIKL